MSGPVSGFAGVGIPALIGTLFLAAMLSALIGSMGFFGIGLILDPVTSDQSLTDDLSILLFAGLFISIFAMPIILMALLIVGIPMAWAFTRFGLSPLLRFLVSGVIAAGLGAAMGSAMWREDPYGPAIGAGFGLLSAWIWLALLLWVERRRQRHLIQPVSASNVSE